MSLTNKGEVLYYIVGNRYGYEMFDNEDEAWDEYFNMGDVTQRTEEHYIHCVRKVNGEEVSEVLCKESWI